jgi:DNA-binding GntR family transcriptional regulator
MPVPAPDAPPRRTLLREDAYVRLRDAILDGTFAPGEQLRDAELCRWLGLSRTPVREAIARLAEQGLVESAPNRWTRVAPLERRDAREAFQVVAALHALAAELATPLVTEVDVRSMRAANRDFAAALRRDDIDGAIAADDAFHAVFVRAAANTELARTLERLTPRVRRLERARFASLAGRFSVKQHDEIVEIAREGVADEVAVKVRYNWLSLGSLVEQSFDEETA